MKQLSIDKVPNLLKLWHPTKNECKPDQHSLGSTLKVWWCCEKGHEWQNKIQQQSATKGCPCVQCRSLSVACPELAAEWHPTKNGTLTPGQVYRRAAKRVWWKCKRGHEWQAIISNRVAGTGCPICSAGKHTSFPELALYYYIHMHFPGTQHRAKPFGKMELDIYIPSLQVGVEYDGKYYHQDVHRDVKKEHTLLKHNPDLVLIRVRASGCPEYPSTSNRTKILHHTDDRSETLNQLIRDVIATLQEQGGKPASEEPIRVDVVEDDADIRNIITRIEQENSLMVQHPEITKEWHPTRNLPLLPEHLTPGVNVKVWWTCQYGHEWKANVSQRTLGSGCPYCTNRKASAENNLAIKYPELIDEWHPTKNKLPPTQFLSKSKAKVWWQCKCGYEWEAAISNRSRFNTKCPACTNQLLERKTLADRNPKIAEEWHPFKNGSLTPHHVSFGSAKKVWWMCKEGHEWETFIHSRNKGRGCPYCAKRFGMMKKVG